MVTPPILLLIGVSLIAIIGFFLRARESTLRERVRAKDEEITRYLTEITSLRGQLADFTQTNAQLSAQLENAQSTQVKLTHEFKALSADALRSNRNDFLEQAKLAFAQLQTQSIGELAQRTVAVSAIVQPLRDSLEKVDSKMNEIEKLRAGAYGALGEQLKALLSAQHQLQTEATRLSTALRSTTYAGSWGELQLRRVVEMADMLPYCDFAEQESAGGLRADLVVRLPGGQRIVVDAKTPLAAFRAASENTDEPTRAACLSEHANKIRGHIDSLGAKNYWAQFQPAPEFVILFLPGDHFLTAALQADNTLMDRALARRVLLATPTTLIALLKAASLGWREAAIAQNAEELSALGRSLYDRVAGFADHLDKLGRGLETAVKGYNLAVGSFEGTLLPGARKLADLGAKGAKTLSSPATVDTAAREFMKPNHASVQPSP